jgi:sugar/nucleoside kinase (ribokinase family)
MVTIDPGARASTADVAAAEPSAVAASLDQLYVAPDGVPLYVTCGDDDARAYAGRPPAALDGVHAVFVNQREVLGLTGKDDVETAAASLAELAETVIVTQAAEGAFSYSGGETVTAPAERVENPVDSTGAGDLLAAAYVWAELHGADPAERLRWAVLYASLAVTKPTGIGGAVDEATLLEAGLARGLTPPPSAGASA